MVERTFLCITEITFKGFSTFDCAESKKNEFILAFQVHMTVIVNTSTTGACIIKALKTEDF